jgi:hypothetical protein
MWSGNPILRSGVLRQFWGVAWSRYCVTMCLPTGENMVTQQRDHATLVSDAMRSGSQFGCRMAASGFMMEAIKHERKRHGPV